MDSFSIDTLVVGAGIVGVAIARELSLRGVEVVVVEAEPTIGSVVSARNSGVIHAGLYYKPGGLKARFCVEGRDMLYAYAAARNIWHRRCGKLVVATDASETAALHGLKSNAERNGVGDLALLTAGRARALEPELACVEALHSPSSGQIDVHELIEALALDAANAGALVQCRARFVSARPREGGGFSAEIGDDDRYAVECRQLINAAGLGAQTVAAAIEGFPQGLIPEQALGKGSYFQWLGRKPPFERLIYPAPVPKSAGLHCRSDGDGRTVLGPDLEFVDAVDYRVDPARARLFFESTRRFFPALRLEDLAADYAGVRPKLKTGDDFVVQGVEEHGMAGLLNCFGVDSPGVTSCMALARAIAEMALEA